LVGAYGRWVEARIAVEVIRDSGDSQASANAGTCSEDVQITSRSVSIWIKILSVN
jgi:hypothetical protein